MEINNSQLPTIFVTDSEMTELHKAYAESVDGNKEHLQAFHEWIDSHNFPVINGCFILKSEKTNKKAVATFNISDIHNIKFQLFQTLNGKNDCFMSANIKVYNHLVGIGGFKRYFDMDDCIEIEYLSLTKAKDATIPESDFLDEEESKNALFNHVVAKANKLSEAKKKMDIEIEKASCRHHAILMVNGLLVLMYHMAQNRPTYLTAKTKLHSVDDTIIRPYKYDGYIDLRQTTKVYTVSTDKNGKIRKFTRHIESWSVRGHKRTYKKTGQTIWVGEHIKGKGELEQRTYATIDISELNLPVKVFNVPLNLDVDVEKIEYPLPENIELMTESAPCQNFTPVVKPSIFKRIANKFKSWF